jgi:UDP-N-acetylmuramate--alanine ligase
VIPLFRGKVRHIHFIGIGGSGMCGIAEVMRNLGFHVTGSDRRESDVLARLRSLGAVVWVGQRAEQVIGADVVVKSTAIGADNVEVLEANRRNIAVIPRAEMLSELMRMKYGIAVAGTHGKTTTTSMLAVCMQAAGLDPTVVVGGRLNALGANAALGAGPFLVAEADESDGSFMMLAPTLAVVTNIDPEHLDHYGTFESLVSTFVDFTNKIPFFGCAVVCLDHPVVQRELLPRLKRRVLTYGLNLQADLRGEDLDFEGFRSRFSVWRGDARLGEVKLAMPGVHNVRNALAVIACAQELDIPFETAVAALESFTGVQRRFTVRAEVADRLIVDDYAHHPVEIAATLRGAAGGFPDRRIVAVFQPHRYTRVRDLGSEFCRCFNDAALLLVCPVYPAGEEPIPGVDHLRLADAIRACGHRDVRVAGDLHEALDLLVRETRPGDLVITLGAGDVNRLCPRLATALGPS